MGRWSVVVVASLVAAAFFAVSEKPVSRSIVFRPTARVSGVEDDLRAERSALVSAGYGFVRRERIAPGHERISEEIALGECVAVVAAARGLWRVSGIEWVRRDGTRDVRVEDDRQAPYRRAVFARVCPMRRSGFMGDRALVAMDIDVLRAGEGSAEAYVLRGPPSDIGADGAPIEGDAVVTKHVDLKPALSAALMALFAVLVIGLMIEATVHGRREQRDRERTLRRFTLAMPAGLRGELEALGEEAVRSAAGARALRDRLSSLVPLASAAVFSRWRADQDVIEGRHAKLMSELASRRASARQSSYRGGADGLAVLTILIRHRCELPELPPRFDALHLALALDSSLPRDDRELIGVDVLWHPRERTDSLDPTQLSACFPELVPLDARAARCASCEAPVPHGTPICAVCGESLARASA